MRWWRAYTAARHDPKLLRLSDKHFRWWFNLLCVAGDNDGRLPAVADMAAEFRMSIKALQSIVDALVEAGLFDRDGDTFVPHNWASRQFKSDTSADRMRRHRERQRDVTCDVTVTRSESETETETESEREVGAKAPPTKRGSRIPDDWTVSEAGIAFANSLGLDGPKVAEAFRDYWQAQSGSNARKLDWDAAYRTWCRRQADQPARTPQAVRAEREARGGGMPSAEPWEQRMGGWRRTGFWVPETWGPRPNEPGTRVPAALRGDA